MDQATLSNRMARMGGGSLLTEFYIQRGVDTSVALLTMLQSLQVLSKDSKPHRYGFMVEDYSKRMLTSRLSQTLSSRSGTLRVHIAAKLIISFLYILKFVGYIKNLTQRRDG